MTDDIVTRLRARALVLFQNGADGSAFLDEQAADEIENLRRCLQHAIDHVGKWGLFTTEEKQSLIAEYEKAVRGE